MATIIRHDDRNFRENPGRIDDFRLFTDMNREIKGVQPQNLNFDTRRLDPDRFSSAYHFHRNSEELFLILSGSATLRTPDGLHIVESGDTVFFEKGESGAHQLYNHTDSPCIYLDIRTFFGDDICEYPDSDKILLIPTFEIFPRRSVGAYFDGEGNIREIWDRLRSGNHQGDKSEKSAQNSCKSEKNSLNRR